MKNSDLVKIFAVFLFIFLGTCQLNAQMKVGDNATIMNSNAVFEIESTNKGMLLPRLALVSTTSSAPLGAHVSGMTVYNTATTADVTPGFYYNNGTVWVRIMHAPLATNNTTSGPLVTISNGVGATLTAMSVAIDTTALKSFVNARSTNTLSNATNTITSTVNGIVASAPAVNTVANTFNSTTRALTTTVNGVTGAAVTISGGGNDSTSASNGLTLTGNDVRLGGSLTGATTLTTSATNTLALAGLQSGASSDSILVVNPTTGVIARKAMPAGMIMKRVKLSSATMQTISDPNTPASPSPIIATYEDSTGAVISVNIVSRTANTSFTIHSATHVGSGYLNYAYPSQGIVLATGPQGPQGPQGVGSRDSTTASNGLTMIGKDVQLGGALTKATSVSGLSATNKMSFTGAGVDAFNVDGTTFSVDATNNRVGIGNALPEYTLDLKGSFRTVHSNFSLSTYGDGTNAIFGLSNSANFPPRIRTSQNSVINWDLNFGNNIDFTYYSAFPTGVSRFFVEGATGNVGIGTSTPNANAILDVSSSTKGMKLPSVSLSAANLPAPLTAHVAGMLVYNTAVAGATPNNVVQGIYINDGAQWILLQTPSQNATDVPVGSVFYRATSTVPTGYLACNGQAVSRTAYATLFATIGTSFGAGDGSTTFNVPDLRGQFVRGWDDGRGVDPGRVFGSWQVDALKSHTHTYSYSHTPNFNTQCSPNMGDGCFWLANNPQTSTPQTSATGGSETRPTNVAMSAIIKF